MPRRWKPWLFCLLAANMILPLFWIGRPEARVVLGTALCAGGISVAVTALTGFTRLVSLGHLLWVPLIAYLVLTLDGHPSSTSYGLWLRMVIALNALSLILDAGNVIRYIAGDREEMVDLTT